ncbi:MAG: hypothetical protein OEL50_04935, partial [Rhodospirillaceae bacterium]|nr:hypothetical protein [Rhodospirillaceae bacterium]
MTSEDQSEIISFLSTAEAFSDGSKSVVRKETHISEIFIGEKRTFKLKRAVKLPYLDFSTIDLRHRYCLAEVSINKRTAPGIYIGVKPVTREHDGSLAIGGSGNIIDWLVEMNSFDEEMIFNNLVG